MTDVYGTHENMVSEPSRDDLTKIKGIGATTAEKLYNAKIETIQQIAEMTPERLSETPGIGLVSATKFIAAAKNRLEASQKEDNVGENGRIQDSTKVESKPYSIENYEVAEVIVDETEEISEESQKEVEEDFEPSQTEQKWFSDKYNYSKLTASYPPISERVKNYDDITEKEEEEIALESEKAQFTGDNEFDTKPEMEQVIEYEEESTQEIVPEILVKEAQPEIEEAVQGEEVDYTNQEPKSIDFENSKEGFSERNIHHQISKTFKAVGCYEIPCSLKTLKQFTTGLDFLGYKLVKVSDDLRILLLFPVKMFDQEGTVLVEETKLELKSHANTNDLRAYNNLEQAIQNLLQVRDSVDEDLVHHQNISEFFQKYLHVELYSEKGVGSKKGVFPSGATQYKVVIEPILLCNNPPRSMEKSIAFPYQRSTNLHAIDYPNLSSLIRFLEKKYQIIESRTKRSNPIKEYQSVNEKFCSKVRVASFLVFGYAVTLAVIYFTELYYLLRLFNTIGYAVMGIYAFLLIILYFRAHKTKKNFLDKFETPYYMQNLEFSEIDLLDFKYEFTDELLTQFGYECLGKHAKFGVIEQSEANTLKNSLDMKKKESHFPTMYESEDSKENTKRITPNNYGNKYISFLEDP